MSLPLVRIRLGKMVRVEHVVHQRKEGGVRQSGLLHRLPPRPAAHFQVAVFSRFIVQRATQAADGPPLLGLSPLGMITL
jgi:hypothetical protein